jgi:hypothetical protein
MNIKRITTFAYVLAIAALIVGLSGCPDSTTVDGLGQIVDFLTEDPPEMEEMEGLSGEILRTVWTLQRAQLPPSMS